MISPSSSTSDSQKNYPTCSTCTHWDTPDEYDTWTHGRLHICMAVDEVFRAEAADHLTALAFTNEPDAYSSVLITAASFGCLLHSDLKS